MTRDSNAARVPLTWHAMGYHAWGAWSTAEGFEPFAFTINYSELLNGCVLDVYDVRRKPGGIAPFGLPILRIRYEHREWTDDQIKAMVETLRPQLPDLGEPQRPTDADVLERIAALYKLPPACRFVHAFPPGATDDTLCLCQKITKGYYESHR